jgi:small subunit ribosomal protein S9
MADEETTGTPDGGSQDAPEGAQGAEDAVQAAADAPPAPAQEPTEESAVEQPAEQSDAVEEPVAREEEAPAEQAAPVEPVAERADAAEEAPVEAPVAEEAPAAEPVAEAPGAEAEAPGAEESQAEEDEEEPGPRVKPAVPGAHLEVDIVPEGVDPLGRDEDDYASQYAEDPYAIEEESEEPDAVAEEEQEEELTQPISTAAIDLASGARYRATGKRKTAIARVTLRPGTGEYRVNGRPLEVHFPRTTLQRNIRQPLETVGYEDRMDVIARLHGGGISAQAGALRHGVSRALLEADPNLRGELKRRGFLTRDSRAKERKKAGLKKARKRPQFSKR